MTWNTAFSYLPIDYGTPLGTVENITQRTYFMNNVSGSKVKLKFSNRFSPKALTLNKVMLGQIKQGQQTIEDMVAITYQGNQTIHMNADEEFYSDEIAWNIEAGSQLVLSIYIQDKTIIQSSCSNWSTKCWRTRYGLGGDFTSQQSFEEKLCREVYPYVDADVNKSDILVGVCEIQIEGEEKVKNITMFGDSITHMSYYSDELCKKAFAQYPGKVTVVNRGIGGNRLLGDASFMEGRPGNGQCFGIAGMSRYQENLFENNTPDAVLILIGVNDIMHPYVFNHLDEVITADQLAEGIRTIIKDIHAKGAKVYVSTIMPFKLGEMVGFAEGEAVRQQFNAWAREQKDADGILDFDAAIRSANDPESMEEGTHIGDGLHPNTLGGKIMADLVPLNEIMGE